MNSNRGVRSSRGEILMAKGANQKLKLLYLMKILLEKTDDEHSITMSQIIASLKAYDIKAERKSIYGDMEALRLYGIDVIGEQKNGTFSYYIGNREFELPELKLLVDSVQSAKFITTKKSNELIHKIEGLASCHEANQLQRQVYVSERIKTMNESIYYNVDRLHSAIGSNVQIRFQYFQWNVKKEMELKHDGKYYIISPWALTWDDENYYLVAFDDEEQKIKHYRVDKMLHIELLEESRKGKEFFETFDTAIYAKKVFGMFHGDERTVQIRFKNEFAGVVIDRFGKSVMMIPLDDNNFQINVDVVVSDQFLGWIIALGKGVKILGPECVVEKMKDKVLELTKMYLE